MNSRYASVVFKREWEKLRQSQFSLPKAHPFYFRLLLVGEEASQKIKNTLLKYYAF